MTHRHSPAKIPQAITAALLAMALTMALAACDPGPETDASKQPPPPAPTSEAPSESTPAPSDVPPPDESPAAPVQPPEEAPPPTDPSPAPKPTANNEPPLESMKSARPPAKAGVPVDLRYSFDGDPATNQPVTLHLAAVPRAAGSNLGVSIKTVPGIQVAAAGTLSAQKANAESAYRQHFSVTRQASAPAELRVLVTMDLPEGTGFGFYSIPLDGGTVAGSKSQKQDSVKQR